MICPLRFNTFRHGYLEDCQGESCAWYDQVDYHCAIVTIADALANIHGHARDVFAKAYGLDKESEEEEKT